MLSFYEFNCLLEETKRIEQQRLSEAPDPRITAALAARAAGAAKNVKTAKVTQAAIPAAGVTPAAPAAAAAPAPAPAKVHRPMPVKQVAGHSPNEPGSQQMTDKIADFGERGKFGIKPNQSKAQGATASGTQADERIAKMADKITDFNNFLASVTYQGLTAMAVQDLHMPYDIPDGRFEIAANGSRGEHAKFPEVVMPLKDAVRIMNKVNSYTKSDGGSEGYGASVSFREALVAPWGTQPGLKPLVLRALEFEKFLMSPDIVGQQTTIHGLTEMLAQKAGKANLSGGLEKIGSADDSKVVSYILDIANKNGFGHFFDIGGDVKDPATPIRVKSPSEAGKMDNRDDGTNVPKRGVRMGRALDNAAAKFGGAAPASPAAPAAESAEWMDVMSLMEHWGF